MLATILTLVMALGLTTVTWADDAKGTAGNPYTLDEFNAPTESISGTVYVSLDGKSVDNGLTIGNDAIADHYQYGEWNSETAPEGYPFDTGRIDTRTSDNAKRHIYSIVEVHNGSSLFTGKAGQGPSNLRQYILEQDLLEAIVAVPEKMFYNTGIATYEPYRQKLSGSRSLHGNAFP